MGWKDGIFSFIMRNFSQMVNENYKWIVFDGDVDPDWIESLNTVMDDNKMLTLASNERVPLNATMRLLIEVSNLRNASPATVSRGGVLMLNETDVGWRPFVDSWMSTRVNKAEVAILEACIDEYVAACLEYIRRYVKAITNIVEFNLVTNLVNLLTAMLPNDEKLEITQEHLEIRFDFIAIWAFGSSFSTEKGVDYRKQFSEWWKQTWIKYPFPQLEEEGKPINTLIFDWRINDKTHQWQQWKEDVKAPHLHMHKWHML